MPYEFTHTFKITDRSVNELVNILYNDYIDIVYGTLLEKGVDYDIIDNLPKWKELTTKRTEVRKTHSEIKEMLIPEIEKIIRKGKQDFDEYILDYIMESLYYKDIKSLESMINRTVKELFKSEDIKKVRKELKQTEIDRKKENILKLAKELGAKVTFDS